MVPSERGYLKNSTGTVVPDEQDHLKIGTGTVVPSEQLSSGLALGPWYQDRNIKRVYHNVLKAIVQLVELAQQVFYVCPDLS